MAFSYKNSLRSCYCVRNRSCMKCRTGQWKKGWPGGELCQYLWETLEVSCSTHYTWPVTRFFFSFLPHSPESLVGSQLFQWCQRCHYHFHHSCVSLESHCNVTYNSLLECQLWEGRVPRSFLSTSNTVRYMCKRYVEVLDGAGILVLVFLFSVPGVYWCQKADILSLAHSLV